MNTSLCIGCLEASWGLLRQLAAPVAYSRLTSVTLIVLLLQNRALGYPFQFDKSEPSR
jgi:hypothetical protein